ncbi:MAG: dihydroorotase [Methanomicrobiales archaeon]|nr:dihydroorotase [Methanomicrobiales archaeon]
MLDLVLKNVQLPDGSRKDIAVEQGTVKRLGSGGRGDVTIDCTSYICVPGAVDMHVHMRGGQESYKEDWQTGSRSALAGGVTLVVDQPNTLPPITTVERFQDRVAEAKQNSYCHFGINAGATAGADFGKLWSAGPLAFGEIFLAPSTQGNTISLGILQATLAAIRPLQALCTLHAEGSPSQPPQDLREHDRERSIQKEEQMVQKICALARGGDHLHFCHLSGPRGIDAVAAATLEVTPHHLFLSLEDFAPLDARGKVNPPLRSDAVRRMLWSRWDRIDVLASDHAPHTLSEKVASFPSAPAGLPGVETMLPLLLAAVLDKKITLTSLIEKTSLSPSRILGITPPGFVPGSRADFALYPREKTLISADMLHSRCGWTPYEGREAVFPDYVFMDGTCAYAEGDFSERRGRWYGGRGYKEMDPI